MITINYIASITSTFTLSLYQSTCPHNALESHLKLNPGSVNFLQGGGGKLLPCLTHSTQKFL